ncbi:hypothetical protein VNO78_27008 [Psophocarpus tetragonolobus]|uniref:Uncharacterized protein n=1 Tax=Psophocarpus tetragonolobus TaxID=3891 RepID=A0AAN9S1N6_PSOTE
MVPLRFNSSKVLVEGSNYELNGEFEKKTVVLKTDQVSTQWGPAASGGVNMKLGGVWKVQVPSHENENEAVGEIGFYRPPSYMAVDAGAGTGKSPSVVAAVYEVPSDSAFRCLKHHHDAVNGMGGRVVVREVGSHRVTIVFISTYS